MIYLNFIFGALAILSFLLLLWQFAAAGKFPLHKKIADPTFSPPVSILKPLKGCDETTATSLESWLQQNYSGPIQILFGVADASDPVCAMVESLIQKFPQTDARLILCPESHGANAKVSTLIQLEKLAKHDLILVSDADVRVPPDFLANAVASLRDEQVGLVNCFYCLANPTTLAMQWEAVAINADFWSQVLQSQTLKPLDFALGAVMLTRRKILDEIGGFKSLVDCLADDYQLGHRIAKKNYRIKLCPVVVECWESAKNWREIWNHQLRWARTIRACQPAPYFFSILSNATLWPLIWFAPYIGTIRFEWFFGFYLFRAIVAAHLQKKLIGKWADHNWLWLVPAKDLLQAAIWLCAFTGNTVEWRGKKMKLHRDGTVEAK